MKKNKFLHHLFIVALLCSSIFFSSSIFAGDKVVLNQKSQSDVVFTENLDVSLSRNELIGAQGYVFTVTGLSKDRLNRGHFVHSIVGLENLQFDYLPKAEGNKGMPLGTQKFIQVGWAGTFANLPAGTYTHRLEAWLTWGQAEPIIIEKTITVIDKMDFFGSKNTIIYYDPTQTDRSVDWPFVPAGTPADRKATNREELSGISVSKNNPDWGSTKMILIRGGTELDATGKNLDINPRGMTGGIYLSSYGEGKGTIRGLGTGGSSGSASDPEVSFMVIENLRFIGQVDLVNGTAVNSDAGEVYVGGAGKVRNCTITDIEATNLGAVRPANGNEESDYILFNCRIHGWGNFGYYVGGAHFIGMAGNYICQDSLAVCGVETKATVNNFPDHGPFRAAGVHIIAINNNMTFSNTGWSFDNSTVGHQIAAHQPSFRINTNSLISMKACIIGNYSEGEFIAVGRGDNALGNIVPAELVTIKNNLVVTTAATSSVFGVQTPNTFVADNYVIIPDIKRFVGNRMTVLNFGIPQGNGTTVTVDPSMAAGTLEFQNNTIEDRRSYLPSTNNIFDRLISSSMRLAVGNGVDTLEADNLLYLRHTPSDLKGPAIPFLDVDYEDTDLTTQFWGLRQRYTTTTLNDTEHLDASYATPEGTIRFIVPQMESAARTQGILPVEKRTLFDFRGQRKASAVIGAITRIEKYELDISEVEGVILDPSFGKHELEYDSNFEFTLMLKEGYTQSIPVVSINRGNGDEVITEAEGKYTISDVRSNVTVNISGVEKNTYTVTMPEVDDRITVEIASGSSNPVTYGGSFSFTVTANENYDVAQLVVKANETVLNKENRIYIIKDITEDVTVTIDGIRTGLYDNSKTINQVWTNKDKLFVSSAIAGTMSAFNEGGLLQAVLQVKEGVNEFSLLSGTYILVMGNEVYKVIVK